MKLPMHVCKRRLALLWFCTAGVLVALMIAQSIGQIYADKVSEAWGWFLPTLMPTLALMCAVFIADNSSTSKTAATKVDSFFFWLTTSLSAAYLGMIALTLLSQPFVNISPLDLMKQSNLWMGPFQALVSGTLGVFFLKAKS